MSCGDLRSLSQITEEKKTLRVQLGEEEQEAKGEEPGPNVLVHAMRRSHNKDPRPRDKRPRRRGSRGEDTEQIADNNAAGFLRPAGLSKVARESREEVKGW